MVVFHVTIFVAMQPPCLPIARQGSTIYEGVPRLSSSTAVVFSPSHFHQDGKTVCLRTPFLCSVLLPSSAHIVRRPQPPDPAEHHVESDADAVSAECRMLVVLLTADATAAKIVGCALCRMLCRIPYIFGGYLRERA